MKKSASAITAFVLILILIMPFFAGCAGQTPTENSGQPDGKTSAEADAIRSLEDLAGKRVGVLTGSINEQFAAQYIPGCKIVFFNSQADMLAALSAGKVEAVAEDDASIRFLMRDYPELMKLTELCPGTYASIFPKTEKGELLRDQMNEFLAEIQADGTMAEIDSFWFEDIDMEKTLDFSVLTGENGTLSLGVSTDSGFPFVYMNEGKLVGYDLNLALEFCRRNGYGLEVVNYNFAGLLAAVSIGKNDFGASGVTVTEERAESMFFSDPTYYGVSDVIVRRPQDESAAAANLQGTVAEPAKNAGPLQKYAGKTIGVITGSVFDRIAEEQLPESSIEYINSSADIALALESGRIDAYIADEPTLRMIRKQYDNHNIYAELEKISYGFAFQKGEERSSRIRVQLDEFLTEQKENGTLSEIYSIWSGENEAAKSIDYSGMTGENGELTLAVSTDIGAPFAYVKYDRYVGYEVDIAVRFCRAYGYSLRISDYSFSGMLAAVAGGRCDFAASSIGITEERMESIDFSVSDFDGSVVLVSEDRAETDITRLSDVSDYQKLRGARIAVLSGTIFDQISQKLIPDCQVEPVNSNADLGQALEDGRADAYMTDQPIARMLLRQYPDQQVFGVVSQDSYAYVFPKDNRRSDLLRAQMNGFLQKLREEKTLREIDSIWFGDDESEKAVDYSGLTGVNGELVMAVSSGVGAPFCYLKDDQYAGYDVDIAVRFCREYGYSIRFSDTDFGVLLSDVADGKCDFGASCITVTEERAQSLDFSDPNYDGGVVTVIRTLQDTGDKSREELLNDMTGKRIGVLTGGWCDVVAEQSIPECQVEYFNTNPDMALALDTGKIDAYMTDEPVAWKLMELYPEHRIYMNVLDDHYGIVFRKNDPEHEALRTQLNEFIAAHKADGTAAKMAEIWFGTDTDAQTIDFSVLTGENGTLRLAVASGVGEPFAYLKDGNYVGYDIDLIFRFCRACGYDLTICDSEFSGVLTAVSTGRCDFGVSSISITEERRQSMDFSDPYYDNHAVLVVRGDVSAAAEKDASNLTGWQSVMDSFRKTFLRENRWQLFAGGIGVTMLITVISAVCGTAIAFLVFLLYRKGFGLPNFIVNALSDILQKTPVVVLLMILYYLIFGKINLDGIWVSCIGFSLIFSCAVLGCLKVAVGAVDGGQMEAAQALGYTDTRAFLRIILPQAMRHFLPAYRSEIVALIKSTAVVGYIAVQDLTKVSDIIRSRTYEAFFPLIASAMIYFAVAWFLTLLVGRLQLGTDPKRRSRKRILKGVRTK